MGYGGSHADAASVVGKSGDGGIDGIIKEDRLGLESIYIQAKRWEGTVGRPVIQQFAGALQGHRARKGVLLTTSGFSREAIEYAANIQTTMVLIDGHQLAELMIDYGVGVSDVETIKLKRLDEDYFSEE
jgi:restriction system protein